MAVTLLLGGDVNVQGRERPRSALTGLGPLLESADVRFLNLEGLLVEASQDDSQRDVPHKPNWHHSGPDAVGALVAAGIDAVSCANNVSFPPASLLQSLAVLDAAGIRHAGAGADALAAHAPCVVSGGGLRFGLLAYSSIVFPYGHAAGAVSAGVAALRASTSYVPDPRAAEVPGRAPRVLTQPIPEDLHQMTEQVRAARAACDVLVVSIHWGLPGDLLADYQSVMAHAAIGAGADVIMGHGPHSVHGIEVHAGKPIFYSLGNLAFDWPVMHGRHLDGLVALCRVEEGRLALVEVHAARRDENNDIGLAFGSVADEVLGRVRRLSPLATDYLEQAPNHLVLRLP